MTGSEYDAHGLESFLKGDSAVLVSIWIRYIDAQLCNCQDQGSTYNLAFTVLRDSFECALLFLQLDTVAKVKLETQDPNS